MARGSPLRQPCNQYWIFLEISSEAKTPAKPLGSMYWSELPFNQFEMNQSDLIDMVLLSQNRISSLSAEEVVQCSLPLYQKNSTPVEAIPESECHQMPAALPSNSQAHKRGLNSRQMVVDGEHCEHARSSARPSSVVTLRENNRPCRS